MIFCRNSQVSMLQWPSRADSTPKTSCRCPKEGNLLLSLGILLSSMLPMLSLPDWLRLSGMLSSEQLLLSWQWPQCRGHTQKL